MARILPETPPTILTSEVLRVFRSLKALPDTFYVWHHLAPWSPNAPDFLIVHEDRRALLVKVSPALASAAIPAVQITLFGNQQPPLGDAEARVLYEFLAQLGLPEAENLETLVVFPNISHEQVLASRLQRKEGEPAWAGKELLSVYSEIEWKDFLSAKPIDEERLEQLRLIFSPEVVVPADMTVRPPVSRSLEAGLTDYLLDYDQERAVKLDLDLSPEAETVSGNFRLNIINGVAGSGKTLILLYRLRLLYHLYPQKRFLVLTHNRPLNYDIQGRFARLQGSLPPNIEWRTFNSWCYQHWPTREKWVEPLTIQRRKMLVEAIWRKFLSDLPLSPQMFLGEIDWVKDRIPMDRDSYLTVDRRGRGFGLTMEQRGRVYDAISAYHAELEREGCLDWADVPQRIWHFIEAGQMDLPEYDVIMVDEAQFFAPLWFSIVQKVLHPRSGHLFVAADPTQGFLGRGISWKSLGLAARGRTHTLRRSYRTTREIMHFASLFYRLRLSDEQEEGILLPDLWNMPSGVVPQLIPLASPQDEITRLANEVAEFVKQGYPKKHLLLLHSDSSGVQALIKQINRRLGKDAARDAKTDYPGDYVRVTTLNAGAGLESPIVFLAGLRKLFEEEQSLRLSDSDRETLVRENTRKLYMAITRAGQRLVLTYVGALPSVLETVRAQASASLP
ncbi:MAG: UvrD-helicase domain-containing protein [Chloroflexota bacterium]